jgi:hypothetical protein
MWFGVKDFNIFLFVGGLVPVSRELIAILAILYFLLFVFLLLEWVQRSPFPNLWQ